MHTHMCNNAHKGNPDTPINPDNEPAYTSILRDKMH